MAATDDHQDEVFTPPPPRPWWPWVLPLVVAAGMAIGWLRTSADEPESEPVAAAADPAPAPVLIPAADVPDPKNVPLYQCRQTSGTFFWSRKPCADWGAKLERTTGVPEGWSFERQVALAEQRRQETEVVASGPSAPRPPSGQAECQRLGREIANIDGLVRQVLDYRQQGELKASRQRLRERQQALGCDRP